MTLKLFSYSWHLDENEDDNNNENTTIKIYGLNEFSESMCVRIEDFTPFIYAELPSNIPWTLSRAQLIGDKIDEILGDKKPIKKHLVYKKKLYYAHLTPNKTIKTFPYLFLSFCSYSHIKNASYKIRNTFYVSGIGQVKLKLHEQDATPILQLTSYRNLSTAGWIEFSGEKQKNQITSCKHEYISKWKNLKNSTFDKIVYPVIMGFDIEVNSSIITAMPKADKPKDKVFQISCVFFQKDKITHTYLLSLGDPDQKATGEHIIIRRFETENDLLLGYTDIINEHNPNVICGYNIMNFDIPYMIDRSKLNQSSYDFAKHGFLLNSSAKEKNIKWSSSAYGDQIFKYLDAEGRLFVDLLPLIKRDYKMDNYKLKTISTFFLGETKDPLSVKGIFKCFRIGTTEKINGEFSDRARKAMAVCGKYCCKDSELVIHLFNKLQTWIGLCEMAKTCNVPIFYLYTQGQQIKVYSQLYKYCMHNDIIVEKDGYIAKDDEHYQGAIVFDPIPGVYEKVLPFDFASLYPSTIIAYNIDYSTLVKDSDTHIKDSDCNVLEWDEHSGCSHDKAVRKIKPKHTLCGHRRFRFLKEPRGVMPTVLQNLLNARENTRKYMKILKKGSLNDSELEFIRQLIPDYSSNTPKEDINALLDVLEKRQLAYKVSANSMYGAMGVSRGYLPFMPGAMSTTAMGRQNILAVSKIIPEKYGGQLVYGDTDTLLPDCPVLILHNSKIEYKTMEELSDGHWKPTITGKEVSNAKEGLLVWSDNGFTKIQQVIRHAITKPLVRVLTHVGCVECTLDHSLLWENGDPAKASEVTVGSKLCISELPLPIDTPKNPIYLNKLTEQVIEDYIIPDVTFENMTAELAFVWGMFYAEGSCDTYMRKSGEKCNAWAISGQDNKLLTRCVLILNKYEEHLQFKILDTMKSSNANKLVPYCKEKGSKGKIIEFVDRYRDLFYDCRRSKRVPAIILNCPFEIRQAFFMGYYAGDGSKKDPAISLSNKGAIGSAGLFYIMKSIGYQVSINTRADKPTIYKLTGSTPEKAMKYEPNAVKKIYPTDIYNSRDPLIHDNQNSNQPEYIYDIETANHHFAAGVGQLIVHNSNYVIFPHLTTAQENWEYAEKVASEISAMFPAPIKLEFEQAIYWRFFILTKKRYMYKKCNKEGVIDEQIGKKGVLLARRDTSLFIRNIYSDLIMKIFNKESEYDVVNFVFDEIFKLASSFYSYKNFIITKSIKNCEGHVVSFINEKGVRKGKKGDYTVPLLSDDSKKKHDQFVLKKCDNEADYYLHCLPAVVQLAEKMRLRGQRVDIGSRLEYVITNQGSVNGKQYEKIEDATYFSQFSSVIKIDYMYYLNSMTKPFDAVLNILYKDQNLVGKCYKLIEIKYKLLEELKNLFRPKIRFV